MAKKIGDARRAKGLTQQQLCQASGLSYSTLAKIERGAIKSPSVFTISEIADSLGTSIESLIGKKSGHGAKQAKKRSKTGVEFVYFDVNGCLVHFYHRAFTEIAKDTGISAETVETAFWNYNDLVCRGDISLAEFNNILAGELRLKSFDWEKYYLGAIEPIPETHQLIKWAHQHYLVGLLSNIMPGLIDKMLAKGLLPRLDYDAVVDSSKTGYIKPEKPIYELAQKSSHVQPEAVLFVDDSRANVMAGGRMGWHVIWFDDSNPAESVARVKESLAF